MGAFFTPVQYCLRERERILDLFEMACGSRQTCNYIRFGGVRDDLPEQFIPEAIELVKALPDNINEIARFLVENEILLARTKGVGVLSREAAINCSATGPVLRASGVPYDVRKAEPYCIYDRFEFDVPTRPEGDCYARFMLRFDEMYQSVRILEQALKDIPADGEFCAKVPRTLRPPEGEVYSRIESPKGELGWYLVSDGSISPYRWHVRAPTLINLTALPDMLRGWKVADVVVIFGTIDIVMGEIDR